MTDDLKARIDDIPEGENRILATLEAAFAANGGEVPYKFLRFMARNDRSLNHLEVWPPSKRFVYAIWAGISAALVFYALFVETGWRQYGAIVSLICHCAFLWLAERAYLRAVALHYLKIAEETDNGSTH